MTKNKSEILGQGKWLMLKKVGKWEWVKRVNTTGVACIYAFTDDDEVILIEQERAPLQGRTVLEIPAGLVGDIAGQEEEDNALAARRELIEETGYDADVLREVAQCPSSPGLSEEIITLYVARKLRKVGPGGGDDSEDITVYVIALANFHEFVCERMAAGVLVDPRVFGVPFFARL